MYVRWLTAFIDRPTMEFDAATRFWRDVTSSTLSLFRGAHGEFATLLPPSGDAYLRVQRVHSRPGGSHLDVHVDDVTSAAAETSALGATVRRAADALVVAESPAGGLFCLVEYDGESTRPAPREVGGSQLLVDQMCLDVPAHRFDAESAFWAALTGWEYRDSRVAREFGWLQRPTSMPLRLLLQRCGDDHVASCHVDIASEDRHAHASWLESLGSRRVAEFRHWIVLADPAGVEFCVTGRDPRTGLLPD